MRVDVNLNKCLASLEELVYSTYSLDINFCFRCVCADRDSVTSGHC